MLIRYPSLQHSFYEMKWKDALLMSSGIRFDLLQCWSSEWSGWMTSDGNFKEYLSSIFLFVWFVVALLVVRLLAHSATQKTRKCKQQLWIEGEGKDSSSWIFVCTNFWVYDEFYKSLQCITMMCSWTKVVKTFHSAKGYGSTPVENIQGQGHICWVEFATTVLNLQSDQELELLKLNSAEQEWNSHVFYKNRPYRKFEEQHTHDCESD